MNIKCNNVWVYLLDSLIYFTAEFTMAMVTRYGKGTIRQRRQIA